LAATWRWPTLAQMNHSELSHMAGAVDDSTINIVEVIIIIITRLQGHFFVNPLDLRASGITTRIASYTGLLSRLLRFETLTCAKGDVPESMSKGAAQMVMVGGVLALP